MRLYGSDVPRRSSVGVWVAAVIGGAACGGGGAGAVVVDAAVTDAAAIDGSAVDAAIDAPRPLEIATVEDLGALPLPSAVTTGRDGGTGGVVAGRLLWTFGDTFTTTLNPVD